MGRLVALSPSVREMAASPQSSAGAPLATAGVWRALAVDLSLRESGESQSAQVSTRISFWSKIMSSRDESTCRYLRTFPLLVKLMYTCTHVSCNNRLYCE